MNTYGPYDNEYGYADLQRAQIHGGMTRCGTESTCRDASFTADLSDIRFRGCGGIYVMFIQYFLISSRP